eukprot:scaffold36_cov397-Prasinococcus_capsulatus_cf.AAC.9
MERFEAASYRQSAQSCRPRKTVDGQARTPEVSQSAITQATDMHEMLRCLLPRFQCACDLALESVRGTLFDSFAEEALQDSWSRPHQTIA